MWRWDRLHTARNALDVAGLCLLYLGVLAHTDPAKADELMKQARELMGVRGALLLPPVAGGGTASESC